MISSKIIITTGLSLDIIGAFLLAYEIFWRPGNEFHMSNRRRWIEQYKDMIERLEKSFSNLYDRCNQDKDPNYSFIESVQNEHNNKVSSYSKRIKELEKENVNIDHKAQHLGMIGLPLLILGFVLQIIGTWC